jgi:hypothetical protein
MVQIKKVECFGSPNCYECRLDDKRLVITTDFGPRILLLSSGDGPNLLFVDETRRMGNGRWLLYGGHRLWVAPETASTYAPDNDPCRVEVGAVRITVTALDASSGVERSMAVSGSGGNFVVAHTVINRSDTLVAGALWALTCITPKATIFFPWGTGGYWDLKKAVYWKRWMSHGTDVKSPQFAPTDDLFLIRPDGSEGKVGTSGHGGFIGATGPGFTFIKRFDRHPTAAYPDEDCAVQCYTCADFVEMETLSPLCTFFPSAPVVHEETWVLNGAPVDPEDGEAVRKLAG